MAAGPRDVAVSVSRASQANTEIIGVARRLAKAAGTTKDVGAAQQMRRAVQDLLKASGELTVVLKDVGTAARAR